MRMTIFRRCCGGSAHLKSVIDAQHTVAIGIFDHGHGRHDAFVIFHDPTARMHLNEVKVGGERRHQHDRRSEESPTPARNPGNP